MQSQHSALNGYDKLRRYRFKSLFFQKFRNEQAASAATAKACLHGDDYQIKAERDLMADLSRKFLSNIWGSRCYQAVILVNGGAAVAVF